MFFSWIFSWLTDRFCHAPVMRNKDNNWNGLTIMGTSYIFQEKIGNRQTYFSHYSMMKFQGSLRMLICHLFQGSFSKIHTSPPPTEGPLIFFMHLKYGTGQIPYGNQYWPFYLMLKQLNIENTWFHNIGRISANNGPIWKFRNLACSGLRCRSMWCHNGVTTHATPAMTSCMTSLRQLSLSYH